jgi:uncharacterized protein (DUF2267 family)
MSLHFYAYARKGYEFIDDIASALNTGDTDKAGRLTRCVLRALRNQLSMDDSFRLVGQLPMALKAVYVDGWKGNTTGDATKKEADFISEVVREDANSAWRDFTNEEEVKEVVTAVIKVLSKHIGPDEVAHILPLLPPTLRQELHHDLKIK